MYKQLIEYSSKISLRRVGLFGLLLALAAEAVTVGIRFGLGLQTTRDTGSLSPVTFGVRIHHAYRQWGWIFP